MYLFEMINAMFLRYGMIAMIDKTEKNRLLRLRAKMFINPSQVRARPRSYTLDQESAQVHARSKGKGWQAQPPAWNALDTSRSVGSFFSLGKFWIWGAAQL